MINRTGKPFSDLSINTLLNRQIPSQSLAGSSEHMQKIRSGRKKANSVKQRHRVEKVRYYVNGLFFLLGFIGIIVLIHFATRSKHVHVSNITIDNVRKQRTV